MALCKRIIPCLDVKDGRVVKGVNFLGLRDAGNPVDVAKRYNDEGADELTFLDITASSDNRDTILHVIEAVASQVFIPLTVGGGVRTVADVRRLPAGIPAQGGRLPKGALQTRTDFGTPGYGGACPPEGRKHRYEFTLTALKVTKLPNITAESTPALVGFFTKANSLGEAKFTVEHRR